MKSYQKSVSIIASVVLAGAAIGAFFATTEKGKRMLSELKKKKEYHSREGAEVL